jgi:hypothetical protein
MTSLTEMKTQLIELEDQKEKLNIAMLKANQRIKMGLWGIGLGVILLPLYWSGVPVLLVAGITALFYFGKRAGYQDKLEIIETEIHELETCMA